MDHLPLTKIIATLGPASSDPAMIRKLIQAGVSIFRLNFSHGTLEDHARSVANIRAIAGQLDQPTAILGDLQGPKIRVGKVAGEGIEVAAGETVRFERGEFIAIPPAASQGLTASRSPARFCATYPGLIDDVQPGQRLLVNDGAVRMLVVERPPTADHLECTVTVGGRITSGKGINLPDSDLNVESLGERDRAHAQWALAHELDFLALSFVRCAGDIQKLRALVLGGDCLVHGRETERQRDGETEWRTKKPARSASSLRVSVSSSLQPSTQHPAPSDCRLSIIAKIELPQAVANIESIIDAADGIMVARGDLGVEMDLARVPVIQKRLLAAAERHGKPCIVATQMLESMIEAPSPTRAEVSDVANAILDGADAVMLSAETSIGKHPALAVEHMRRIALETEAHLATLPRKASPPQKLVESRYRTAALAHGVWTIAQDIAARVIVVWSQQGGGARYLSQNNFCIPIIAATSDARAARRMQLLRGVIPIVLDPPTGANEFVAQLDRIVRARGLAEAGDQAIFVAGGKIGTQGVTNGLSIHTIGSVFRSGQSREQSTDGGRRGDTQMAAEQR